MRFVTHGVVIVDSAKKKTAIVMIMRRFMTPGRDLVDIDIEQHPVDKLQACQAGFLDGFTVRHLRNIGLTIGMPARLHPDIELFMMRQQRPRARGVQYPGRTGNVTDRQLTQKTIGIGLDERGNPVDHGRLFGIASPVVREQIEYFISLHDFEFRGQYT